MTPRKPNSPPVDAPVPEALRWTTWTLRLAVAVQCVGAALPLVLRQQPSALNEFLFLHHGVGDAITGLIDQVAGFVLLGVAAAALLFPMAPVVLLASIWSLAAAWATQQNMDNAYASTALPGQALRFLAPVALILLLAWPRHHARAAWRLGGAMWVLRLAVAALFIAHGYEAFALNPRFTDYILAAGRLFFQADWPQATAEWMLRLIGVQDVLVAVALLGVWPRAGQASAAARTLHRVIVGVVAGVAVYQLERFRSPRPYVDQLAADLSRSLAMPVTADGLGIALAIVAGLVAMICVAHWRGLLVFMACWGAITALARVIHGGLPVADEALVRACHLGAPLAILLLACVSPQSREAAQAAAAARPPRKDAPPTRPKPQSRPSEIPLHTENSPESAIHRRPI